MKTHITYKKNGETINLDIDNVRGVTTDYPLSFIHCEKELFVINFDNNSLERREQHLLKEETRVDMFILTYTSESPIYTGKQHEKID